MIKMVNKIKRLSGVRGRLIVAMSPDIHRGFFASISNTGRVLDLITNPHHIEQGILSVPGIAGYE